MNLSTTLAVALAAALPPSTDDAAARVAAYLDDAHEAGVMNGYALVMDGDREVLARAFGPADADDGTPNARDTRFRVGSITKLFTSAAVMRLVDRGVLDLDEPVSTVRPALPHAERMTLRQLLNFRSGLPQELDDDPLRGVQLDAEGFGGPFLDVQEVEVQFEPGSRESYSNVGYWYAGAILETATGKPWRDAVRELVLDPLGMEDTGLASTPGEGRDAAGHETVDGELAVASAYSVVSRYASGSMSSTVDDLRRFCLAFTHDEFLSDPAKLELFRRFRLDRQEMSLEGGPVLTGSGFVPGWRSYLRIHPEQGHLVILLNNVTVMPPPAIAEIGTDLIRLMRGDAPRGFSRAQGIEMEDATDGLPDTSLGRAAEAFLAAAGEGDVDALVAWNVEHGIEDDVRSQMERIATLRGHLGGWTTALYRENGARELMVAVRGTAPVDALFTFRATSLDPLELGPVEVGQARR